MRLLYFHQHFSTPGGAAGTRSYEFARRLVMRGHSVTMVTGSYGTGNTGLSIPFNAGERRGIVDGIDVIEFELPYANADSFLRRTWIFLHFVWRSVRVAISFDYDLVFATSTPLTVAIPGIVARIFRGRTFILEIRDLWPELPRAMGVIRNPMVLGLIGLLETCAYRAADACIGLAPGIVEGIRRKAPNKRVILIPNGSDLEEANEDGALPVELEALLTRLDGKLKCLFAGAHGIANGLDAVLDAATELHQEARSDIVLIFVGAGMSKPSLIKRAQDGGLDNCLFLDPLPKRVLFTFQRRMDVGLMILQNVPAFYDGTSPNKFFDYLACQLPVLINYPGWLAQLITDGGCGLAVRPGDPIALANALKTLAASPEARREMGQRARRMAEQYFSRERLAREFAEFLEAEADGKAYS